MPPSPSVRTHLDASKIMTRFHWNLTNLKPSFEPCCLARKPLSEKSIALNVLKWQTGGLNIDKSRYAFGDPCWIGDRKKYKNQSGSVGKAANVGFGTSAAMNGFVSNPNDLGRWPANSFLCPKPSPSERDIGCDELEDKIKKEHIPK